MRKDRNFLFNMIILYLSEISVSVNTCLKNKLNNFNYNIIPRVLYFTTRGWMLSPLKVERTVEPGEKAY